MIFGPNVAQRPRRPILALAHASQEAPPPAISTTLVILVGVRGQWLYKLMAGVSFFFFFRSAG
jgi:hypothetical protein